MQTILRLMLLPVCFSVVSCIGPEKMCSARKRLDNIKTAQAGEIKQLQQISATTSTKLNENKIDSTISKRFDFRINRIFTQVDSVSGQINLLDSLMARKKSFRRNYKSIIIPGLELLDSFRNESSKRNQVYLMMEDGLNGASYTLYNLAAYFGPGKYEIPEDQLDATAESFAPLVDSVLNFSGKYQNFKQTAVLVILGFADATGFDTQTPLYNELSAQTGQQVTKEVLNQKLSEMRALSLIKQLKNQVIKKLGGVEETENISIEYVCRGKGEELPFKSITDYKDDDERRRIVLCYWAILPR
jgi:outer membrane protein OmpA-like peptidoglycan-associated protein